MNNLKDKHQGQTAWIIGKGPSLQYLKKEDIGEGVVIAISSSITIIESLGLSNPVYSLQKDGGTRRKPTPGNLCPDCDYSGDCGEHCGDMIRPKSAGLLLHDIESKYCFPDYAPRYVFDLQSLNLPSNVFSLIFSIRIAQYMGCNKFNFVSFDAHANGDCRTYTPGEGIANAYPVMYQDQRKVLPPYIKGLDYRWITPGNQNELKIAFGVITNHPARMDMAFRQSEITGRIHRIYNPDSATKGLNEILMHMEEEGQDVGILTHHDMSYRSVWLPQVQAQLALLPDSWIVAGIIGKDMRGRICGKFCDTRIPMIFETSDIHTFPTPASCFDECCIMVNLNKGFRFDESLDGFDLYGTMAVLQTWEMGGTAWIIDSGTCSAIVRTPVGDMHIDIAYAQHHCTRPFTWFPDEQFCKNFKWLHERFPNAPKIDTTVLGVVVENLDKEVA